MTIAANALPSTASGFNYSRAAADELRAVPALRRVRTKRTPADFINATIRPDRGLMRDPAYRPRFFNTPLTFTELDVILDECDYELFLKNRRNDLYEDDGAELRDVVLSWWETRFI